MRRSNVFINKEQGSPRVQGCCRIVRICVSIQTYMKSRILNAVKVSPSRILRPRVMLRDNWIANSTKPHKTLAFERAGRRQVWTAWEACGGERPKVPTWPASHPSPPASKLQKPQLVSLRRRADTATSCYWELRRRVRAKIGWLVFYLLLRNTASAVAWAFSVVGMYPTSCTYRLIYCYFILYFIVNLLSIYCLLQHVRVKLSN